MSIFNKTSNAQPLGRNSFDLSQKRLFTASAGELLPCYVAEALPGDKFQINVSDFLRTQTCNTAAFSRIKQYVHFFFVPYRLLSTQLSQYLMRSPRVDSTVFSPFNKNDNTFAIFKYQMSFPYYDVLIDLVRNMSKTGSGIKITDDDSTVLSNTDFQDALAAANTLKLLDLLEYGVGSINYSQLFGQNADTILFGQQELNAYIGNKPPSQLLVNPDMVSTTRVNLLRLLAYNRIYQDFYRDPRLETFNSIYSNIDDRSAFLPVTSSVNETTLYNKLDLSIKSRFHEGDFTIRYRNYPKDYFTASDVNPFQQDSLLNRLPYSDLKATLSNPASAIGSTLAPGSVLNGVVTPSSPAIGLNGVPNTTLALRSLYALERWTSRQAHAKSQSYADLVKAHFGITVPDGDDSARFLGGTSGAVVINENISTASTETASLGALSGVGKSTLDRGNITFEAKEHGIIMGIFSLMPEVDYNAYGIDRHNMHLLPEDFFVPEYDGLGYQPVNTIELSNISVTNLNPMLDSGGTLVQRNYNSVFGFMPIYSEYRTKVDKVFSEFRSELPLSYWVNPRRVSKQSGLITADFCKCRPYDLDSIFQVNWISKSNIPAMTEKTDGVTVPAHVGVSINDQFFVNLETDCKAIRHMSDDGVIY